jgi:U3 small nucleolar RNA-associated protein 19
MEASGSIRSSAEVAKDIKRHLRGISDERADAARLDELRRIFGELIRDGEFHLVVSKESNLTAVQKKWQQFLRQSYHDMVAQLCDRIRQGRRTAIRTLWGVIASSPVQSSNDQYSKVSPDLLYHWLKAMIQLPEESMDKTVHYMVEHEFLQPFRDVQYFVMLAIIRCAKEVYDSKKKDELAADRLVQILKMVPFAKSQKELDKSPVYLVPPPSDAVEDDGDEEEDEDDDSSSEDESMDETDIEDASSDEEHDLLEKESKAASKPADHRLRYQQFRAYRKAWCDAWHAVLRLPLSRKCLKEVLQFLPENVVSIASQPLRFADFFMAAYEQSGVVSLLALDGLFTLITEEGLEYPCFYKQLYKIVVPSLFYVKYRLRFFRLLDRCLGRNDMLPAHIVAAFLKRLLRCALSAPPPGILYALALTSNLLRKHPETSCLIHREGEPLKDAFDNESDDPEKANALQSSLWELNALSQHYYPSVVTLAKSIGQEQELSTPLYDLENFLSHSHKSLFEQERKRKRKEAPLTFVEPTGLFSSRDVFAGCVAMR